MITSVDGVKPVWEPLPKQQVALSCPAFELLYGGSKGGAKTNYLVTCAAPLLQLAHKKWLATGVKQYKCRILVFRKNLDDLKDFVIKTFEIYPFLDPEMGASGYNKNEKTWHFTSGATVEMKHLDGPSDHEGFNGQEITALLFDEVQFIPFEAYRFLVAQVRSSDADYRAMNMIRCTANPGGEDWLIKYFGIDECPQGGKIFTRKVQLPDGRVVPRTRAFIRSFLRDNKHIDPDGTYEATLRSTMSEDEVAMYMDGDFFRVAKSFFSKLLQPRVHLVRSFPVPSSWDFCYAIDWGSTNPASWHLGAKDPDGRVFIIDELHGPGVTGRTFGEKLKDKFARQAWCKDKTFRVDSFYGVIDKQALDNVGGDSTPGAGIQAHGFRIFPAQKDRISGCEQMKERLLLDRFQRPQLVIFEDRCPELVKALSAIPSNAPRNPEEYNPDSQYAHACDSLRFLLMNWPLQNRRDENPVDAEVARWNRIINAQKKPDLSDRTTTGYGDD